MKTRMSFPRYFGRTLFLGLAILSLGPPGLRAGLDPELNSSYQLQVVLRLAQHRQLTDAYRSRLAREARDDLQAACGELAAVTVVHDDPLLGEIGAKGLDALDSKGSLGNGKRH